MRIAHLTIALVLAVLVTPSAIACQLIKNPPPAQKMFWASAPPLSQLEAGEVVLEVAFRREAETYHPAKPDVIVVGCGTRFHVYDIVRVVGGKDTERVGLLIPSSYDRDFNASSRIFVGRFVEREGWYPSDSLPDADTTLRHFEPRPPPR